MADLPEDCRRRVERVRPKVGDKARWIVLRWENSADATDRQIARCAEFYDTQQELMR